MFKRSRFKIILLVIGSVLLLFISLIGIIYASSYADINEQNREMLQSYVDSYSLTDKNAKKQQPPEKKHTNDMPPYKEDENPRNKEEEPPPRQELYRHIDFYSVAYDNNGNVLKIDNSQSKVIDEEAVINIAETFRLSEDEFGRSDSFIYLNASREGYNLTVFMDNTLTKNNMRTLMKNTFTYSIVCIAVIVVLSTFLSYRIVAPLEVSYTKQKQFISDAGHELKTPVSVISANAELLEREIGSDNVWLSNIVYENEKMSVLISQLLELSRTERVVQQFEQFNMSRTVMGEILAFESIAYEKNLTLESDVEDNIMITGSSKGIAQLTGILLDNAVSHCTEGGNISLTLKEKKKSVVLTVINDGNPIPPEHIDKIFDRFYRADPARGDDNHYGLGLSIAKAVVTSHKGKIDVRCFDGKVEFTVQMPLG